MTIPAVVLVSVAQGGRDTGLPERDGPDSYRIVYRIDVHQLPSSTSYEERVVKRPFAGRLLISIEHPPRLPVDLRPHNIESVDR